MTSHLQLLKHVLTFHNSFKSFGFLNVVFLKDTHLNFLYFLTFVVTLACLIPFLKDLLHFFLLILDISFKDIQLAKCILHYGLEFILCLNEE